VTSDLLHRRSRVPILSPCHAAEQADGENDNAETSAGTSLVLVPAAERISANHNETVLAFD
jgi:hypothetical protein